MRLAFVGKGGAGKSALCGTFCRLLARAEERVLVLDSDPMPGLALSLGVEPSDEGIPEDAVVENPAPEGPRFVLRADLDATGVVDRYAIRCPDGVLLLQLGKLGGHPGTLVRSQFAFRQVTRDLAVDAWHLVGDLPGGTRQPFFGWGRFARTVLVVVEPTAKSTLSAKRLRGLRDVDDPPRVLAVANKVREVDDAQRIESATGLPVVAAVPWDEALATAERLGLAPLDHAPASPAVRAVESLVERLRGEGGGA